MRAKVRPLLCELHAHTTWSDGVLTTAELVDLYGRAGFDVLCITDHVVRAEDPWVPPAERGRRWIHGGNHGSYLAELEAEGARARRRYGLLVVPGLELSYNDLDPALSAHAVAVGCREFVAVDDSIEQSLEEARGCGAALVAAHPDRSRRAPGESGNTRRFAREWRRFRGLVDRWELFNGLDLFGWVAERGLPAVASGDFHRPEHLESWKTLLPCARDEGAVVAYLRSPRPVYISRVSPPAEQAAAA